MLRHFLNKIKSYDKDNIDFLNSILGTIDPNTLIATFDVTNLYSSIPYELGKQAISYGEKNTQIHYTQDLTKFFITDGIEIILNNNSFQFNNINYMQTLGTAMGTKMAPTYATLTLSYLEENLYEKIGKKYGNNIKETFNLIMEKILGRLLHIL